MVVLDRADFGSAQDRRALWERSKTIGASVVVVAVAVVPDNRYSWEFGYLASHEPMDCWVEPRPRYCPHVARQTMVSQAAQQEQRQVIENDLGISTAMIESGQYRVVGARAIRALGNWVAWPNSRRVADASRHRWSCASARIPVADWSRSGSWSAADWRVQTLVGIGRQRVVASAAGDGNAAAGPLWRPVERQGSSSCDECIFWLAVER